MATQSQQTEMVGMPTNNLTRHLWKGEINNGNKQEWMCAGRNDCGKLDHSTRTHHRVDVAENGCPSNIKHLNGEWHIFKDRSGSNDDTHTRRKETVVVGQILKTSENKIKQNTKQNKHTTCTRRVRSNKIYMKTRNQVNNVQKIQSVQAVRVSS